MPPAPPWWLVPNLLALDAPVVAVVWQRFLAARAGVPVGWAVSAALAAAVWAVYLADRALDARRGALDADRHHAAARHPLLYLSAACGAALLAVALSPFLPANYLPVGFAVALGVGLYLVLAHAAARRLGAARGAKELLVAVGFAAGVAVPLLADGPAPGAWLPGVAAFAGVCWLNCRLIDRWEGGGAGVEGAVGTALLGAAGFLPAAVGLAVAGATLGLLAVHLTCRARPRAARVLADAVLLAPLACGGVP